VAIFDFFVSRNGAASTPENYVGHTDRLFYNSDTGEIRISDGVTAGGLPIPITLATSTVTGGVKLGPGVALNGQNQIVIDSTGLDFNFGDFQATTETDAPNGASLSVVNADQDINIVSNGTGHVNIIGEFNVYKPDGDVAGAMAIEPIFKIKNDGQIKMLVPGADSSEGAVSIVGGLDGVFQAPLNTGVMLHVTGIAGTPGIPSRIYNDSQNAFSAFVSRRYNNTAASPSAVLDGEEIMRLSGTAHNGTTIPGTANQRIVYRALGNQTPSNQGGNIELLTTPLNSTTLTQVATIDNANGITATKFTGPLTGNVTGNVTGTLGHFTNINANVAAANAAIITANTAMQSYVDAVTTAWTANAATQQVQINSLATGANANTAAYLTTATGNITAGNISDSVGSLRSIPQNSKNTGYTLQSTDNGQMINITTGNVTVPAGVFNSPFGQTVSIYNNQTTSNAIVQGSGVTLRLAGTLSTGNRTLARYGVATMVCVAANTFVISGAGLS